MTIKREKLSRGADNHWLWPRWLYSTKVKEFKTVNYRCLYLQANQYAVYNPALFHELSWAKL